MREGREYVFSLTRLTLAKPLLTESNFFCLDEPTASLDDIAHKIRAVLKEEPRSSGLSVLYTSHNMRQREEMQSGRLVADGTCASVPYGSASR